ncbi:MAG TPA: hypothetical protein VK756_00910 [Solirubrobacteraceae bacterium]|jgi:hypothetical protein|nr:hypothetical protein [Solirubrobacteraceae bacterium]
MIAAGLRSRGTEVTRAICAGIAASASNSPADHDAEYQAGRAVAVAAIIEYSLDAIERKGAWGPIPQALAAHTRRAARIGVRPGIVVRRFLAGHRRFMDLIHEEVQRTSDADPDAVLEYLRETYRALLEHLIASIEHEYDQECERVARSPEQHRIDLVQRLLAEDVDPDELQDLDYEVHSSWHLGVIAIGAGGGVALRRLTTTRRGELLSVSGGDGTVWAWLGGPAKLTAVELKCLVSAVGHPDAWLAIGEPGSGLDGWRETHHEAQMALPVARHVPQGLTRCADALPVVAALQSEAIITMYEKTYVLPLNKLAKRGQSARKALRAYFQHGRNVSSAANALDVSRGMVERHLNEVRNALGHSLNLTALEIALRLEELGYIAEAKNPCQAL